MPDHKNRRHMPDQAHPSTATPADEATIISKFEALKARLSADDIETIRQYAKVKRKPPKRRGGRKTAADLERIPLDELFADEPDGDTPLAPPLVRFEPEPRYVLDHDNPHYLPKTARDNLPEELRRMFSLRLRLARLDGPDRLDRILALRARHPHAAQVIEAIAEALRHQWQFGRDIIRLRPTILVGNPGTGKTRLARDLARRLGLPQLHASAAGDRDGHLLGTSASWSTAMPSIMTVAVARTGFLNPCILLDEIDKAERNQNGDLASGLLPLLEPGEARRYREKFLAAEVDASWINWILTANDIDRVPRPLISRCDVYRVPDPEPGHVPALVRSIRNDLAAEFGLRPEFLPIPQEDIDFMIESFPRHRSVRILARLVREAASRAQDALACT